jgi:hypothetical protein
LKTCQNETTRSVEDQFEQALEQALNLICDMRLPIRLQVQIQKPNRRSKDSVDRHNRLRAIARKTLDHQILIVGSHRDRSALEIIEMLYQCEALLDDLLWPWRQPEPVSAAMVAKAKGVSISTDTKFSREAIRILPHRKKR